MAPGSPDRPHTNPQPRPPSARRNSALRPWSGKASPHETQTSAATHHTAPTGSPPYESSPYSSTQTPHAPSNTFQRTAPQSSPCTAPPHPRQSSPHPDSASAGSTRHGSRAPARETHHGPCHAAPAQHTPPPDPTYPPAPTIHPPPPSPPPP